MCVRVWVLWCACLIAEEREREREREGGREGGRERETNRQTDRQTDRVSIHFTKMLFANSVVEFRCRHGIEEATTLSSLT